jgi:succinate dehydrogenase / fumarate reductase, flavoprotein subunit
LKPLKAIVVGGGLAGLSACMRLCENGAQVDLVSLTHVKRSHSVCAQGGINAALNLKEENDSPYLHAYDTFKGGDFLGDQPPILEMCLTAPKIIQMLDRFGCPFNRVASGGLDARRFGGTLYNRTVFCGASTGQQLLYTLDEQVRRYEVKGLVKKYESHEFMRLIQDDEGKARGIVLMHLFNQRLEALKADVVVIATGGPGMIFRKSTNSTFCTGAANGRLYKQGMHYANGEFIQIHPTSIPGNDKLRLISESVRGEGGRVWVPGDSSKQILAPNGEMIACGKTGEPWYFLEQMYPGYGNLVSRDVGAREILRVCELGLGVDGRQQVYLDVTHLPNETQHKLESVLDIYKKFTGEDPRKTPMRIFPGVHYSMGGAWVDWPASDDPDREKRFRHMTNLSGCFNCGESDFLYHGANRLGANSLLSCIYSGLVVGDEAIRYLKGLTKTCDDVPSSAFEAERQVVEEEKCALLSKRDGENVHMLHEELSDLMVRHVTVVRENNALKKTYDQILKIRERAQNVSLDDTGQFVNQTLQFALQFPYMVELALVITKGALLRDEFRGSHYKPESPERDDKNWLKTTIATYDSENTEPVISYKPVDVRHAEPALRDYTKAQKKEISLKNLPEKPDLPL